METELTVCCESENPYSVFAELCDKLRSLTLITGARMEKAGVLVFVLRNGSARVRKAAEEAVKEYSKNKSQVRFIEELI